MTTEWLSAITPVQWVGIIAGILTFVVMGIWLVKDESHQHSDPAWRDRRRGLVRGRRSGMNYTFSMNIRSYAARASDETYVGTYVWKVSIQSNAPSSTTFVLQRRDKLQEMIEKFGFGQGFETNDPEFDAQVFIDSDNQELCDRLRSSRELRYAVMRIFQTDIATVELRSGYIEAVAQKTIWSIDYVLANQDVLNPIVDELIKINTLLPAFTLGAVEPTDRLATRAVPAIIAISIVGLMAARMTSSIPYSLSHPTAAGFIMFLVECVVAFMTVGVFIIRALFKGSARGSNVLRMFLSIGTLGIGAWVFAAVYAMNIKCDRTSATLHEQTVLNVYKYERSGKATVAVASWDSNGHSYVLDIDEADYAKIQPGDKITIFTHPGFLGFEWIGGYEVMHK